MLNGYDKTYVTAKVVPSFDIENFKAVASGKKYNMPDVENMSLDLTPVNIILASEHENLNGDYFSREELIKSFKTPIHKPFNIEHTMSEDESYISQPFFNRSKNTIIGHMVYSAIADKNGNILSDSDIEKIDSNDDPKRSFNDCIDIVATAVLYNFIFPKTVSDIKESSSNGQMFVSMECWFKGYDFLVNGEIIKSTEDNIKELTDKWSKGERSEDGRRISRVLKDVLFGAVAATPTPANPGSIFLSVAKLEQEYEQLKRRHNELHILQSINPCEEYIVEHDAVEKSAASIMKKIEETKNGK